MLLFMTIIGTRPTDFMYMMLEILGLLMWGKAIQGLISPFVMAGRQPTHLTELIPAYGKELWFTKTAITRAQFLGKEFKVTNILKRRIKMKHIFTVFFTIILVVALCTNTYATESDEKGEGFMDSKVAETIESQMSRAEKEILENIDSTLSNEPLLKIYNEISWRLAGKSPNEMIVEAEEYNETATYKDYYVLTDTPYRVKFGQGQVVKDEVSDAPQYIKDIRALSNQVEINGKQSVVTGVYCFDGNNSHNGIIVYVLTQTEALVRYYDHPYSEALLFSEGDFRTYASDYYTYITSYENNYDEFGEPTGGGMLSFKDFISSSLAYNDNIKEDIDMVKSDSMSGINTDSNETIHSQSFFSKYGTIFPVIILGLLLLIGSSVISYRVYKRRIQR